MYYYKKSLKMLPLSKEKFEHVKSLLEKGYSYSKIANECKVSKAYISKIRAKHFSELPYPVRGRKKALTQERSLLVSV